MTKERIVVVEDEEDILELVKYRLEREGYPIVTAGSGEEALKIINSGNIDLMVLDLMLPGINGLEIARMIKNDPRHMHISIVMLTAKGEESDIVAGLEIGADDYVTKPFSPRVLIARIRAVIRKNSGGTKISEGVINRHGVMIHPGRRSILVDGKNVDLTYTEFQILHYLASRPGWVFTRSQIVDAVRGDNYAVTDRSVDVQMVGLRKKLLTRGGCIETVRGVGYKFKE